MSPIRTGMSGGLSVIFAASSVLFLYTWIDTSMGGFNMKARLFNWHPMLMVTSMILFVTYGILSKQTQGKYIHASVMSAALITASMGMFAVIETRTGEKDHGHMDSIHSYIGLIALLLFLANFCYGICKVLLKSKQKDGDRYRDSNRGVDGASTNDDNWDDDEDSNPYLLSPVSISPDKTAWWHCYMSIPVPKHRTLGLFAVTMTYSAAISGVYKLAKCSSAGGCRGGTSLLLCLCFGLLSLLIALRPEYLHPENLCTAKLDSVFSFIHPDEREYRNNTEGGDDRDNLLDQRNNSTSGDYESTTSTTLASRGTGMREVGTSSLSSSAGGGGGGGGGGEGVSGSRHKPLKRTDAIGSV